MSEERAGYVTNAADQSQIERWRESQCAASSRVDTEIGDTEIGVWGPMVLRSTLEAAQRELAELRGQLAAAQATERYLRKAVESRRDESALCAVERDDWRERAETAETALADARAVPITVWAVVCMNYYPSEVHSLWASEALAQSKAAQLGNIWDVEAMTVYGCQPAEEEK